MNGSLDDLPHVLIVDDDRRLRELLGSFLSANGCRVSAASGAADARLRMQGMSFDLLVLDVMMPGETGLDFAASLRTTGNDVPILMLSARAEIEHRIEGLSAGVDDYLTKPFEPRELLLRVQAILKRHASIQPAGTEVAEVNFGAFSFNRAVDVQINRIRRKIEDQPAMPVYLQTVRGHGYTLHVD